MSFGGTGVFTLPIHRNLLSQPEVTHNSCEALVFPSDQTVLTYTQHPHAPITCCSLIFPSIPQKALSLPNNPQPSLIFQFSNAPQSCNIIRHSKMQCGAQFLRDTPSTQPPILQCLATLTS